MRFLANLSKPFSFYPAICYTCTHSLLYLAIYVSSLRNSIDLEEGDHWGLSTPKGGAVMPLR